jgi:DNA-binding GntR family transcriptional regulator
MDESIRTFGPAESSGQIGTLASSVYQRLLTDILSGVLQPGHKLRLQKLAETYAVGSSPLREALNRLSTNGMVTREENKGFRVSPASAGELEELFLTRCWLEEIALRESIRNGDSEWEERLVLAFHRLSKMSAGNGAEPDYRSPEWEILHREYHMALLSACGSRFLLGYCAQLNEQTLRYRNLVEVVEYRDRHEGTEHRNIQDAILDRNEELAVELLHAHYSKTAEIIIAGGRLA